MKSSRSLVFALPFCLIAILVPSCAGTTTAVPYAAGGVLDLAGWDFERDGTLELSGEWRFLPGAGGPECREPGYDDSSWGLIPVPGFWDREMGGPEGHGWLRLHVNNVRNVSGGLAVFIQRMQTAGRLFVNGREIMHDGHPGTDRDSTAAFSAPHVANVAVPADGGMVIAWELANFHNWHGGPRFAPELGRAEPLVISLWAQDLREMLATGFILMMGVYSLILWFLRREEKASLFLAFLCLAIALRVFSTGAFLQRLFPAFDLYDLHMRIETTATLCATVLFVNFLRALFPGEISRLAVQLCNAATVVVCAPMLALPCWVTTRFTPLYNILFVPYAAWILFTVIRAAHRRRSGSAVVLAGTAVVVLTLLNDTLFIIDPHFRSIRLFWLGLIAVIVSYSSILSFRFARACRTAASLSEDLRAEVERQTLTISRQNRELQTLMRERTDMFVNFNHDLKTPLTLMSNHLDKHIAEHGDGFSLSLVRHNLEKLKRDVSNSLDLEKMIHAQPLYDHDQAVSLAAAVGDKVDFFRISAEAKGVRIEGKGESRLAARIDPCALDRILDNLLENAIRHTGSGGRVTVSYRRSAAAGRVELSVEDTGIGINPSDLKEIFKPYRQIRRAKDAGAGLGMGLPIVKLVCREAGADIEAKSEAGRGSLFTLRLVAAPADTATALAAHPARRVPPVTADVRRRPESFLPGRDTLLVIEDNEAMLASLQDILEGEFNVACASSGREAVRKLADMPAPEIILSDIMMDEMDGYQVLDFLADSDRFRAIPLIFLTARSLPEERLTGLDRGAVDVVHKPFDPEELKARIRSLIRTRKSGREAVIREARTRLGELLDDRTAERERVRLREEQYHRFRLTHREREIIPLLLQGLEYKEISAHLTISLNTVKPYIRDIYRKCGIKNRTELIGLFRTN